jgi:hypothetical protein
LKTVSKILSFVACLLLLLTGCSPKVYRYNTSPADRLCEVSVHKKRAEGYCVTKGKDSVSFELWSEASVHYSPALLLQGLNSSDKNVSITEYGLLINGVEQGPSSEKWNRLLRDPKLLCLEACGTADWRIAE